MRNIVCSWTRSSLKCEQLESNYLGVVLSEYRKVKVLYDNMHNTIDSILVRNPGGEIPIPEEGNDSSFADS